MKTIEVSEVEGKLVMKFRVPPGVADSPELRAELRKNITEVVKAASELNIAHGGPGLQIVDARMETWALRDRRWWDAPRLWWRRFISRKGGE
jgi:NurA-like 5'-3' nuclease